MIYFTILILVPVLSVIGQSAVETPQINYLPQRFSVTAPCASTKSESERHHQESLQRNTDKENHVVLTDRQAHLNKPNKPVVSLPTQKQHISGKKDKAVNCILNSQNKCVNKQESNKSAEDEEEPYRRALESAALNDKASKDNNNHTKKKPLISGDKDGHAHQQGHIDSDGVSSEEKNDNHNSHELPRAGHTHSHGHVDKDGVSSEEKDSNQHTHLNGHVDSDGVSSEEKDGSNVGHGLPRAGHTHSKGHVDSDGVSSEEKHGNHDGHELPRAGYTHSHGHVVRDGVSSEEKDGSHVGHGLPQAGHTHSKGHVDSDGVSSEEKHGNHDGHELPRAGYTHSPGHVDRDGVSSEEKDSNHHTHSNGHVDSDGVSSEEKDGSHVGHGLPRAGHTHTKGHVDSDGISSEEKHGNHDGHGLPRAGHTHTNGHVDSNGVSSEEKHGNHDDHVLPRAGHTHSYGHVDRDGVSSEEKDDSHNDHQFLIQKSDHAHLREHVDNNGGSLEENNDTHPHQHSDRDGVPTPEDIDGHHKGDLFIKPQIDYVHRDGHIDDGDTVQEHVNRYHDGDISKPHVIPEIEKVIEREAKTSQEAQNHENEVLRKIEHLKVDHDVGHGHDKKSGDSRNCKHNKHAESSEKGPSSYRRSQSYDYDTLRKNKDSPLNKVNKNQDVSESQERKDETDNDKSGEKKSKQLKNPALGSALTNDVLSRQLITTSGRVCYACSSANDLNCLKPDRRTTVKYCRKSNPLCVTRTFKADANQIVTVRDCASSCYVNPNIIDHQYEYCSLCGTNLCNKEVVNGAFVSTFNAALALFLLGSIKLAI